VRACRRGVIAYSTQLPAGALSSGGLLDLGASVRDYAQVRASLTWDADNAVSRLHICTHVEPHLRPAWQYLRMLPG
jgi:hypothetical protein